LLKEERKRGEEREKGNSNKIKTQREDRRSKQLEGENRSNSNEFSPS
jgi:hypothetical protein